MPYPVAAKKEEGEEEGGVKEEADGGAAWDGVFEEGGQWYLHGQVRVSANDAAFSALTCCLRSKRGCDIPPAILATCLWRANRLF